MNNPNNSPKSRFLTSPNFNSPLERQCAEMGYEAGYMAARAEAIEVKFMKLIAEAHIPQRATTLSIGHDLRVPVDTVIPPGRSVVKLGVALEMPPFVEGKIEARSGFSAQGMLDTDGLRRDADVLPGKIDPDYRETIGVIVYSREPRPFLIAAGERIAQLTFYRTERVEISETDVLSTPDSNRKGGFGHTGSR